MHLFAQFCHFVGLVATFAVPIDAISTMNAKQAISHLRCPALKIENFVPAGEAPLLRGTKPVAQALAVEPTTSTIKDCRYRIVAMVQTPTGVQAQTAGIKCLYDLTKAGFPVEEHWDNRIVRQTLCANLEIRA